MTIELINLVEYAVLCDAADCRREVEGRVGRETPAGWPEFSTPLDGSPFSERRMVFHFCPEHGADVSRKHAPRTEWRRRFLRRRVLVVTCACGEMPEHVGTAGKKWAWLDHVQA